MSVDKRSCMARARQLLSTEEPNAVRYAALELRLCMEAITYEKLRSFSSSVNPHFVLAKDWQPPQAVKFLLEFEPQADKSFTLAMGVEDEYGQPAKQMNFFGEHKALPYKWLRKHYNKIGKILHVPTTDSEHVEDPKNHVTYLEQVIKDFEEVVAANILGGRIGDVFEFTCEVCKKNIICNADATTKTHQAVCPHHQCGAEYLATIMSGGQCSFALKVSDFDCIRCKSSIPLENHKLVIGLKFACASCGQRHQIVTREWAYSTEENLLEVDKQVITNFGESIVQDTDVSVCPTCRQSLCREIDC